MSNSFSIKTYSPSDVDLVVSGYTIAGWDSISIRRRFDSFKPVYGIRAKHTRVRMGSATERDTSSLITFTLAQESQSNELLSYIHESDIDFGTGRLLITLKDKSGKSIFSSDTAYILNYAESTFTNDFGSRQWRIFCQTTATYVVGGNARPSTGLLDSVVDRVSSIFN